VTITDNNNGVSGSTQTVSLSGSGVPPQTLPGTYTLTVAAVLTTASGTLTHTIPLTLTVT
jgi:surface-anchored protein